jgi:hypothetical protein
MDLCATWCAVQGLLDALQAVCRSARVLVVCDEHHHAPVEAAWGSGTDSAFSDAAFALILTGTPIRTDGAQSVWLAYDDAGAIDHPGDGTFTLTSLVPSQNDDHVLFTLSLAQSAPDSDSIFMCGPSLRHGSPFALVRQSSPLSLVLIPVRLVPAVSTEEAISFRLRRSPGGRHSHLRAST